MSGPAAVRRSPFLWALSKWIFLVFARLWLRVRIEGLENVPERGPVLLVANHSSYLDPPLVGVGLSRWVAYLAQAGLAKLRPMRWWLCKMGVTLIDRSAPSKDAIRLMAEILQQGGCVCVFPEGTRTSDGRIHEFKGGLRLLLLRSDAVVVPVGLDGPVRAFPRGAILPRPRRCVVRYGAPRTRDSVLREGGVESLREEIARLSNCPLAPRSGYGRDVLSADHESSAGKR
ncbi:MAG: lysophospholipid acyltransferase family protein [Planctomycetota bacterium]